MSAAIQPDLWSQPADVASALRLNVRSPEAVAAASRFMARVDRSSGCWVFTGHCDKRSGYGRIKVTPLGTMAHRIAYTLFVGPIPDGMYVCHRCDNPRCVNPAHLFLGTQTDNMRDMAAKGRHAGPRKTRCHRGHPLEGGNLLTWRGKVVRSCRQCQYERNKKIARERRARQRAARS